MPTEDTDEAKLWAAGDRILALEAHLRQALRQWKMYAEIEERDLHTEASTEAEMYRAALAVAERR